MSPREWTVLVTAEHGGRRVPTGYAELFEGHGALLDSHRGWDPGTADLAADLAARLDAPAFVADVTRLLVDLNRSATHPRVFSELTRALPASRRRTLLDTYHTPHRARVRDAVARLLARDERVLHLGIHSFTPLWEGVSRSVDLALLYDPGRPIERALARGWARALKGRLPDRRIRRNHPYRGASDGLTTTLRALFPAEAYLGFEIEVSQAFVGAGGRFPAWIGEALADTLIEALPGTRTPAA